MFQAEVWGDNQTIDRYIMLPDGLRGRHADCLDVGGACGEGEGKSKQANKYNNLSEKDGCYLCGCVRLYRFTFFTYQTDFEQTNNPTNDQSNQ